MEQTHGNTTVARLEVQRGQGQDWEDAGQIHLLDENAAAKSQSDRVVASRKKMLPRSVKLLLSPNARIKADRRANFLYRHSADEIDTNLIVLLHGAGDSHLPFHALAKRMSLPQTASLSINASSCNRGFTTLPFGLGSTWFEEMDYSRTGNSLPDDHPQRLKSLDKAVARFTEVVNALSADEGWHPERIFLFGYSSGACLAMETCLRLMVGGGRPLGGAICVAGGVKGSPLHDGKSSSSDGVEGTPILIVTGSEDEAFPPSAANNSAKLYNSAVRSETESKSSPTVDVFVKEGKGHAMIESQDEMRVVMEFLAKRLVQRMPAMEGLGETRS